MSTHRTAAACLALSLLSLSAVAPARASDVYKCVIGGTTHYQDFPCPGSSAPPMIQSKASGADSGAATPAAPAGQAGEISEAAVGSLSIGELNTELRSLEQRLQQANTNYQNAVQQAMAKLPSEGSTQDRQAEADRLGAEWTPKIDALRKRKDEVQAEMNRQCPDGINMRENSTTCRS
ncbi:DUF4124 domain-containing protein [Arenimonas sp. MALMAid1274]|uniref:DUF4124 domain-containing protein n=1 Tax=Arenimonas sp. MALMAid1274 TaxID=3411630 RepID=UPI003B9F23B4